MKLRIFCVFSFVAAFALKAQTLETLYTWPAPGLVGDPQGPMLVSGTDLIGMTSGGGANNGGFIFKIADNGTLTKIVDLDINAWTSKGGLILGSDGNYYGATFAGGPGAGVGFPGTGVGRIFKLTPGGTYTVLATAPHKNPVGELLEVSPLVFVGAAQDINNDRGGAVYKADFSGPSASLSILKTLDATNFGRTRTGLIKATDGKVYGTTERTIFRMDIDGQNFAELHRGNNINDPLGRGFESGVIEGADGKIYGIASSDGANGKGSVFRMDKDGANYTALHHFDGANGGGATGGNVPQPRLLLHTDGIFYGATHAGGASNGGVLFKLTPDGGFTKLRDCGASAPVGLVENAGVLVVTTSTSELNGGRGVIYDVATSGASTVRYAFADALGSKAAGAPILASDGHIYGTTFEGGAADLGTFWRRKSTGEYDVLASSAGSVFGKFNSALIESADGKFYGTSNSGVIFSATKDGALTRIANALGNGVAEGGDGALYTYGDGRLFRITKAGSVDTLRTFSTADGTFGYGPPAVGDDGAFYGVATSGGANGVGTIWRFAGFTNAGTFSVLRSFSAGELPSGPLVKGRDGAFYGLTTNIGISTRYRITSSSEYSTQGSTPLASGQPTQVALVERNLGKFYAPLFLTLTGPTLNQTSRSIFEFGSSAADFIGLAPTSAFSFPLTGAPAVGGLSRGTDRNLYGVLPDGTGNSGSLYRVVMPSSGDALPAVTTLAATNVQSLSATLNGTVTPNGTPSVVFFEYGATTAYGKRTPAVLFQPGASPTSSVSVEAFDLTRNAEFHFRIVAENDGGTATGADQTATTTFNSAPRAVADNVPIRAKEMLTISVLANDSDPDGDAFTMDSFTQGANGVVTRVGDTLVYTPGKSFAGTDTFTYTLSDSNAATSIGHVTIRNPFLDFAGGYAPLVGDDDGTLTLKVTTGGVLTGKLTLGTKRFSLKGTVGLDGAFSQRIKRTGLPDLVVTLNFTNPGGLTTISGSVNGAIDEQFPVSDKRLSDILPAPATIGKYTILLDPGTIPASLDAYGWATAILSKKGAFAMAGLTPDGKPFSLGGKMRMDTSVLFFKPAKASASGYLARFSFADAADSDLSGTFRWTRAAVTKGSIFLDAIDTTFALRGCKFTPPAKGIHTLTYTAPSSATARISIEDKGPSPIVGQFAIDEKDKASFVPGTGSSALLKITLISRTDGRIDGRFAHIFLPNFPIFKFRGVQLQTAEGGTGPNKAYGLFTTPTAAGTFDFTPQ